MDVAERSANTKPTNDTMTPPTAARLKLVNSVVAITKPIIETETPNTPKATPTNTKARALFGFTKNPAKKPTPP
jgi:hypothetical protein